MKASLRLRIAKRLLAIARSLAAANLTQKQRDLIKKYMKKRRKDLDFGDVIPFDSEGRAYFPVTRTIKDIQAPQEIMDELAKLGYSISSYRDGKAIKTIEVRDGKKTMTKNIGRILNNEVHDDYLYRLFMNRLGTSNKNDNRQFAVCITHNPEDVGAMSTGRNWTSCMQLRDETSGAVGKHYKTALRQVQYGGMCAYLIDQNDRTIENPYARVAIKRMEGNDGSFIYIIENRAYGDFDLADECGMIEIVERELDKSNAKTQNGGFRFQTADPESYSDTGINVKFMLEKPEDILKLPEEDFMEYAFDQKNIDNMDDMYVKSIIAYISQNHLKDQEHFFELIYRRVKSINQIKFLETFLNFMNIRTISMKERMPLEFIRRHPDLIHWPSVVRNCGENRMNGGLWYSWKELEAFSDRLENAKKEIELGRSMLNFDFFYGACEKALEFMNRIRPQFLNEFTMSTSDNGNGNGNANDDYSNGSVKFTSTTSLADIMDNGGSGGFIDEELDKLKHRTVSSIRSSCDKKHDMTFDGKSDGQILEMIESGEAGIEYAKQYENEIEMHLSNRQCDPEIQFYFTLNHTNATIHLEYNICRPFDDKKNETTLFFNDIYYDFSLDDNIVEKLCEIIRGIFKEMFK